MGRKNKEVQNKGNEEDEDDRKKKTTAEVYVSNMLHKSYDTWVQFPGAVGFEMLVES